MPNVLTHPAQQNRRVVLQGIMCHNCGMLDCKTCGEVKPYTEFWKQRTKRGYFAECKSCQRERNKKWINNNQDRYRQLNAAATKKVRSTSPERTMVNTARARAKKRGIDFSITHEDVHIPDVCPVLGIQLHSHLGSSSKGGGWDDSPSIDRIDNNKGYTPDNIVVVSWRANRVKSHISIEEIRKLLEFYDGLASNKRG